MLNLQNVGQGCGAQLQQCCSSMANIKIYNSCPMRFYARSNHFRDINFSNFKQYVKVMEYSFCYEDIRWQIWKSKKSLRLHFRSSSGRFRDINFQIVYFQKVCQGYEIQLSQGRYSMANINIYKHNCCIFYFC